ncbi:MAG TPA: porin [Burkholderiaceae bacterium]|nr:porin [Burkholderiaceae bacterium]
MKKSLLALAVLGAFAGVASAQSSVTLYGTVDLAARYVKNDGQSRRLSMANSGLNSSQLVFSGKEDLGGGLWAGFNLNTGVAADTGNPAGGSQFWNRRSTVSLGGGFGEIRLGRDYSVTFWNQTIFDAFGTNGVGDSTHVSQFSAMQPSFVRTANMISYLLPSNIGGIYGQFQAAASEGANSNAGRYIGGRVGFAAGPFDIAGAFAEQRYDLLGKPQQKIFNIGASYDLSVAKLMGYYERDTLSYPGFDKKENRFALSAVIPVGQGEIHVGGERSKLKNAVANTSNTITQYSAGYVYNLSKRTALYTTVSRLKNGSLSQAQVDGGGGSTVGPLPTLGGKSTGADFGIRHFF